MVIKNNKNIDTIYKGSTEIDSIYKGNTLIFRQGEIKEQTGSLPMTLNFNSIGKPLLDYKIYGNLLRDGAPTNTFADFVPIQTTGELVTDIDDPNYGKYKIAVIITDENDNQTETDIYLNSPICKAQNAQDYIDFANQKVVRAIAHVVFKGTETWNMISASGGRPPYYRYSIGGKNVYSGDGAGNQICNYLSYGAPTTTNTINGCSVYLSGGTTTFIRFRTSDQPSSVADVKSLMKSLYDNGHPFEVYYVKYTPAEETIELPKILTLKGIVTIDTSVTNSIKPNSIYVKYRSGSTA